ncbi:hypothetical protein VTI74DRAFT_532 [Chaetomium olivicolor]
MMRLQALVLSLLASTGLANPIRRDVSQPAYTLRVTSPVTTLNNQPVTTSPYNTTHLGIFPRGGGQPIRFYPVFNPATGLAELHSLETGHTLAVMGTNGLLDFVSFENPAAVSVAPGTTLDWTSFRLDQEKKVLRYAGGEGSWVAFPDKGGNRDGSAGGAWVVKWKGDDAWTTMNYMPVEVVYELVKED